MNGLGPIFDWTHTRQLAPSRGLNDSFDGRTFITEPLSGHQHIGIPHCSSETLFVTHILEYNWIVNLNYVFDLDRRAAAPQLLGRQTSLIRNSFSQRVKSLCALLRNPLKVGLLTMGSLCGSWSPYGPCEVSNEASNVDNSHEGTTFKISITCHPRSIITIKLWIKA